MVTCGGRQKEIVLWAVYALDEYANILCLFSGGLQYRQVQYLQVSQQMSCISSSSSHDFFQFCLALLHKLMFLQLEPAFSAVNGTIHFNLRSVSCSPDAGRQILVLGLLALLFRCLPWFLLFAKRERGPTVFGA